MADANTVPWPAKARDIHNHHMNSTVWDAFRFRGDDIVIATYAKSGTTWTQQIVSQLVFNGAEGIDVHAISPWVDLRVMPPEALAALDGLPHRRFMKTHLPVDALVFSPQAKYIYIGRDGRDALWSFYNHHASANDLWYDLLNNTPGRVGPPIDPPLSSIVDYYRRWMDQDGYPLWSFWENVRSWWAVRDLPNVKLVHFNDLKADLARSIRGIAAFLDIDVDEARFADILEHCSFDYMKANADHVAPLGGAVFTGGGKTFINKGTNGRWRDVLTNADCEAYCARARAELGDDCALWLAGGGE